MLPATIVTIASFLLEFCSSSPVYSMQPAYIIANIGTTGRNIRNLPCVSRKTNEKGVCMFAIDCLKANGTHLGTCIDRFYFGSCCHIEPSHDIVGNTIDTAIIPAREPPSRLSSTTKLASTSVTEKMAPKITHMPIISTTVAPKSTQKSTIRIPLTAATKNADTTNKPQFSVNFDEKVSTVSFKPSSSTNTTIKSTTPSSTTASSVPETTEVSYKLTTFQTVDENTVHADVSTATTTPKSATIKTKPTVKVVSTLKPSSIKPRSTLRPKPPVFPTKPVKVPKPTFKPVLISTRIPSKPTKATLKPTKTIPKKPRPTVSTVRPPISKITKRPTAITKVTTTSKPPKVKNTTTSRLPITTEKVALITKVTKNPKINATTESSRITQPPSSTKVASLTSSTTEKLVLSTSALPVNASTTQSNDLPVVSSGLGTVNGNPATNEIEQAKPLQPPPTTEEPNSSLITWAIIDEETTIRPATTLTPEWVPITTPDGWVLLPSLTTLPPGDTTSTPSSSTTTTSSLPMNNTTIHYNNQTTTTSTQKPLEAISTPTAEAVPFNDSSSTEKSSSSITTSEATVNSSTTTISTISTLPVVTSTIANLIDAISTTETSGGGGVNMSDFTDVCGRRMYPEARIVGGESATFGKWPWQISLRQWRTSTYLHKCGAALLNENWAITAAHCVDNVPPSDLLLRLGEHDLSTDNEPYIHQERRVQIVASHPQFDPRTFEYDLALLRFYEPVPFQPNIIPVCVPSTDENFVGRTAYVTGWGRLYEDGPLPSVLQEVAVPVINNTVCESMYSSAGFIEHIPHIFICAGYRRGGFDSCEGDSGGPMVIQRPDKRFILAGVISWGIGCAEPNQPGVYTRISEFKDWINQILQF